MMSGSASWMMRRTSARVSARQPPRDRIRSSMRREAAFPVARFASAPGLAFAPAFGGDLDLVADLRGLLARDVPLSRLRPRSEERRVGTEWSERGWEGSREDLE